MFKFAENRPYLINYITEGEILEKFAPKKESSIEKFINFRTPKKRMFKLCSKKKQPQKMLHPKKVVKVEKGEANGNE